MKQTVTVNASRSYTIHIGHGLLDECGILLQTIAQPCRIAVITDDKVSGLYLPRLLRSLSDAGFAQTTVLTFPNGEQSKTLETANRLYLELAEAGITRGDLILALGGGVVGDVAGFVAATFLRGLRYVQIPTTLLAQVDSSVGGKTAVDLPCGKNLVGAFWQPALVLCDVDLLDTLEPELYAAGMAEVLKYGLIRDRDLFGRLSTSPCRDEMDMVIARCITLKRDLVQADEFDTGERMLLNFGHTLGHAVELYSHYSISHGQAVAIGMVLMARACAAAGILPPDVVGQIEQACHLHGLPIASPAACAALVPLCMGDKKRQGDGIHVVLLQEIGSACIRTMPLDAFQKFVCEGNA